MDRDQAWQILCEFTKSDSLRKHALSVEACVAAYARKLNADETKWRVTALLHDFDWEIHPQLPDHPIQGEPILKERGVSDEIRRAILSHAIHSGVPRESPSRRRSLPAMSGRVHHSLALVKPNRSMGEVNVNSSGKR